MGGQLRTQLQTNWKMIFFLTAGFGLIFWMVTSPLPFNLGLPEADRNWIWLVGTGLMKFLLFVAVIGAGLCISAGTPGKVLFRIMMAVLAIMALCLIWHELASSASKVDWKALNPFSASAAAPTSSTRSPLGNSANSSNAGANINITVDGSDVHSFFQAHSHELLVGFIVVIILVLLAFLICTKIGRSVLLGLLLVCLTLLAVCKLGAAIKNGGHITPKPPEQMILPSMHISSDLWYRVDWTDNWRHWNYRDFKRPLPSKVLVIFSKEEPEMTDPAQYIISNKTDFKDVRGDHSIPMWIRLEPVDGQNIEGDVTIYYEHHDG